MKDHDLGDFCNELNKAAAKQRAKKRRWEAIKEWLGIGPAGAGIATLAVLGCLLILVLLVIAPLFLATLFYFGWNLAIVTIFGMPAITFWWQSIGMAFLVMVASAIFKSLFTITVNR